MNRIKLGDPLDETTEVGPISNARQFTHVTDMVNAAKADGAAVLSGRRARRRVILWRPRSCMACQTMRARRKPKSSALW